MTVCVLQNPGIELVDTGMLICFPSELIAIILMRLLRKGQGQLLTNFTTRLKFEFKAGLF